jgi:hypothetical protein
MVISPMVGKQTTKKENLMTNPNQNQGNPQQGNQPQQGGQQKQGDQQSDKQKQGGGQQDR